MPINKGLGGFCFLKSVKDEIILQPKKNIDKLRAKEKQKVDSRKKSKF